MRKKRLEIISQEIKEEQDPERTDILILMETVSKDKEIYLIFKKEETIDGIGYSWRYMGPRNYAPYNGKRVEKMQKVDLILSSELSRLYKNFEESKVN